MSDNHETLRVVHYLRAVREEEGGVVRCVLDLCDQLAGDDLEITLATPDAASSPRVVDLAAEGVFVAVNGKDSG